MISPVEIGVLAGFAGSAVPEILKAIQARNDQKHEIVLMKLQMRWERQEHQERMDEIHTGTLAPQFEGGSETFGRVSAFVRPVLTMAFFALFALVRIQHGFEWTGDDSELFAAVITYWFGGRGFARAGGRAK